ncbi:uncharacterized protein LOC126786080 [Argentina anserina]|uniref:uncharacterized protein LOC126786080 n=1 Tax=Argentina anserina TaxID=57926 RepID=UPI00217662BE|nr:uncharacterized protein LOC126786080 [Potentilla anserina]
MPLLWKKGRISQMLADLQSPKRRGGSMVVQTGFPTSLIDLIVKNRDRLRRQSKKNKKMQNSEKSTDFDPVDQVSDQIVSSFEKGVDDLSIMVEPSSGEIDMADREDHGVSEDNDSRSSVETDADSSEVVARESPRGSSGDSASVFVAVAVLALCTTKFAVGFTLSAFLLMFLELVGKHFLCLVKPCSYAKSGLGYMARRIGYAMTVLRSDVVVKERNEGVVFELVEPGVESDSSIEEIEVMSSGSVRIDEGGSEKSLIECLSMEKKVEVGDHTEGSSGSVCKESKSKGRKKLLPKMGAKSIKKFVSKKLRVNNKKHQSETEPEPKPKPKPSTEGFSAEVEESEGISPVSVNSESKCEKQEADGMVNSMMVGKKGTESKGNFGHLILFLIALAGLVGGRLIALLLTITWCFTLKVIRSWSGSGDMPVPMKSLLTCLSIKVARPDKAWLQTWCCALVSSVSCPVLCIGSSRTTMPALKKSLTLNDNPALH